MQYPRLNEANVGQFQQTAQIPADGDPQPGIVHLGIGAFHRAHQAVYTDNVMRQTQDHRWHIVGVSLRSAGVRDQLAPQDGLYTVLQSSAEGQQQSIVNAIDTVLVAPEDPNAVLSIMTAKSTRIISLTITEKGYCHDPATGNLNLDNVDIQHDLQHPEQPKTAIGYLVASLKYRFESDAAAPTVLCCDNLPNNGRTLSNIVEQFARQLSTELADWISREVPFPNTMVDRIVPATTPEDIEQLARREGYTDLGMVKTEQFSQWVIEDNFVNGRPRWELAGALVVQDVEPYENAKLRLLNGAHSALAYSGFLAGYQYVHEVMQDDDYVDYLRHLMLREVTPTLVAPPGLDLTNYVEQLLQRFSNPALHHRTYQIAMDGSQKMPQRLLHTIEDRLDAGASIDALSFAVVCWLRYTMGFDTQGQAITVQDPFAAELRKIHEDHSEHIDRLVDAYLSFDKVFSGKLRDSSLFREKLAYWLSYVLANGVSVALKSLLLELLSYSPKNL